MPLTCVLLLNCTQRGILTLLSVADERKVGVEVGMIANPGCALPLDIRCYLSGYPINPADLPATLTPQK